MADERVIADGRRARRERNRVAVVEAMFELISEGAVPPAAEALAERAGVSVSSVFRYFDNLDDLLEQTVTRYFARFAGLFDVPDASAGSLEDRIATLVTARLDLYEAIGPIARVARVRAADQPRLGDVLADTRRGFEAQVREHFAEELRGRGRVDADDRVAIMDCLTAFESWDLLVGTHGRSRALVARAWTTALRDLLAQP